MPHNVVKMTLRGGSIVICDRLALTEYSFDGRKKRRMSYQALNGVPQSLSAMSQSDDVIVIDSQHQVHRLNVATGRCVWTNGSLAESAAICCDEADRVFVAVGVSITVLDSETGEFIRMRQRRYPDRLSSLSLSVSAEGEVALLSLSVYSSSCFTCNNPYEMFT